MKLMPLKETAEALGISAYELRQGALAGRYPFLLCGNKRLFDADALAASITEKMAANQAAQAAAAKSASSAFGR